MAFKLSYRLLEVAGRVCKVEGVPWDQVRICSPPTPPVYRCRGWTLEALLTSCLRQWLGRLGARQEVGELREGVRIAACCRALGR